MKVLATQSAPGVLAEMALGDLDGDGFLDLVSGSDIQSYPKFPGAESASTFLGKGDGTFVTKASFPVSSAWYGWGKYSSVADLNRDGVLDLVTTSPVQDSVNVRQGVGDGSFLTGNDYGMGANPSVIAIADLNADGNPDIASAGQLDGAVSLRLGMHECTFASTFNYPDWMWPLVTSDFDGDGLPDLVAVRGQGVQEVVLLTANGTASLAGPTTLAKLSPYSGQPFTWWAVAGDLNGDGRLDLVLEVEDSVQVLLNTCR